MGEWSHRYSANAGSIHPLFRIVLESTDTMVLRWSYTYTVTYAKNVLMHTFRFKIFRMQCLLEKAPLQKAPLPKKRLPFH